MSKTLTIACIYAIVNKWTDVVVYVGKALDHMERWKPEARRLAQGTYPNWKLQAEVSSWGISAFVWRFLEIRDGKRVSRNDNDVNQWLCDRENHWKGVLLPTCNLIEPSKTSRLIDPRFDPLRQEIRRQLRRKRRSTH